MELSEFEKVAGRGLIEAGGKTGVRTEKNMGTGIEVGGESVAPMLPIEHWPTPELGDKHGHIWPPETRAVFGLAARTPVTREVFAGLLHPEEFSGCCAAL